jgi:two-component system, cell cycle sensor histidine kinase and response regulator CckA
MRSPAGSAAALRVELLTLRRRIAELEAALAARHEDQEATRFRGLVETAGDWIWETDHAGTYTYASPKVRDLLGYEPAEVVGRTPFDLMPPEEARRLAPIVAASWSAEKPFAGLENWNVRKDGSRVLLETSGVPFFEGGRLLGYRGIDRDVTERKRAEEALRRSEAALKAAQRVAHVGSWTWHVQTNCLEWSDEMYRIFGILKSDFSGDLAEVIARSIHPEDRAAVEQSNRSVVEARMPYPVEYRVVRPDGTMRVVWAEAGVLTVDTQGQPATLSGIVQDITERRRTEDDLRQSVSLLRATLESTADGILVVNREGAIVGSNERFARMWRFSGDSAVTTEAPRGGSPIPSSDEEALAFVLHQLKDREGFLAKVRELYAHPEAASFDTIELEDGRVFERYSQPQTLDGHPVGRVWSFRDVTSRMRAEEERRQLEAQMQQAQKLESLGVLAGGIAHDFNNLLTAILGHADLALLGMAPEAPGRDNLREIASASRRAAELCRQMLAYAGRGRMVVEPVDLSRLVQDLVHLLQVSISKKALLRCRLAEELPVIEADPAQVRQVVMNLVINASEAIGDHDGVIGITTGALECSSADLRSSLHTEEPPPGRYVFLEVADTGHGMDAETQRRVFDPFFTTKFAGRGLGLAAVLGIVRKHNGAIRVASEPGAGTTFRILFPAGAACGAQPEAAAAPEAWRGSGAILLVDDEEAVRHVATKMLEHCGFRVLTASDGREAIALFRQHRAEIAGVLLDLTMPHMDGEQTFRELRRLQPDVRVILASGYSDSEIMHRFADEPLAGALEKPYQLQSLRAKLREVLAPGRSLAKA